MDNMVMVKWHDAFNWEHVSVCSKVSYGSWKVLEFENLGNTGPRKYV